MNYYLPLLVFAARSPLYSFLAYQLYCFHLDHHLALSVIDSIHPTFLSVFVSCMFINSDYLRFDF